MTPRVGTLMRPHAHEPREDFPDLLMSLSHRLSVTSPALLEIPRFLIPLANRLCFTVRRFCQEEFSISSKLSEIRDFVRARFGSDFLASIFK